MISAIRLKIAKDIGKSREIRGMVTELSNHTGWELKKEQIKLDKKIEFFKNLEKKLNKE